MSPPRKRLNFVLPRRSPRCSSSSSIKSGNEASQREIKSWLGIGGTCLVIGGTIVGQHCRPCCAGDCDGPKALGRDPDAAGSCLEYGNWWRGSYQNAVTSRQPYPL